MRRTRREGLGILSSGSGTRSTLSWNVLVLSLCGNWTLLCYLAEASSESIVREESFGYLYFIKFNGIFLIIIGMYCGVLNCNSIILFFLLCKTLLLWRKAETSAIILKH